MKPKAQPREVQIVRELAGLALIGFALWLAAIGWLPVSSANVAPGAPKPSFQADAPLKPKIDARQTQIGAY